MKHFKKKEQGIVKSLILIIAAIILIAYFRDDLQRLLTSAKLKDALLTAISWTQHALIWAADKLGWTSSKIK